MQAKLISRWLVPALWAFAGAAAATPTDLNIIVKPVSSMSKEEMKNAMRVYNQAFSDFKESNGGTDIGFSDQGDKDNFADIVTNTAPPVLSSVTLNPEAGYNALSRVLLSAQGSGAEGKKVLKVCAGVSDWHGIALFDSSNKCADAIWDGAQQTFSVTDAEIIVPAGFLGGTARFYAVDEAGAQSALVNVTTTRTQFDPAANTLALKPSSTQDSETAILRGQEGQIRLLDFTLDGVSLTDSAYDHISWNLSADVGSVTYLDGRRVRLDVDFNAVGSAMNISADGSYQGTPVFNSAQIASLSLEDGPYFSLPGDGYVLTERSPAGNWKLTEARVGYTATVTGRAQSLLTGDVVTANNVPGADGGYSFTPTGSVAITPQADNKVGVSVNGSGTLEVAFAEINAVTHSNTVNIGGEAMPAYILDEVVIDGASGADLNARLQKGTEVTVTFNFSHDGASGSVIAAKQYSLTSDDAEISASLASSGDLSASFNLTLGLNTTDNPTLTLTRTDTHGNVHTETFTGTVQQSVLEPGFVTAVNAYELMAVSPENFTASSLYAGYDATLRILAEHVPTGERLHSGDFTLTPVAPTAGTDISITPSGSADNLFDVTFNTTGSHTLQMGLNYLDDQGTPQTITQDIVFEVKDAPTYELTGGTYTRAQGYSGLTGYEVNTSLGVPFAFWRGILEGLDLRPNDEGFLDLTIEDQNAKPFEQWKITTDGPVTGYVGSDKPKLHLSVSASAQTGDLIKVYLDRLDQHGGQERFMISGTIQARPEVAVSTLPAGPIEIAGSAQTIDLSAIETYQTVDTDRSAEYQWSYHLSGDGADLVGTTLNGNQLTLEKAQSPSQITSVTLTVIGQSPDAGLSFMKDSTTVALEVHPYEVAASANVMSLSNSIVNSTLGSRDASDMDLSSPMLLPGDTLVLSPHFTNGGVDVTADYTGSQVRWTLVTPADGVTGTRLTGTDNYQLQMSDVQATGGTLTLRVEALGAGDVIKGQKEYSFTVKGQNDWPVNGDLKITNDRGEEVTSGPGIETAKTYTFSLPAAQAGDNVLWEFTSDVDPTVALAAGETAQADNQHTYQFVSDGDISIVAPAAGTLSVRARRYGSELGVYATSDLNDSIQVYGKTYGRIMGGTDFMLRRTSLGSDIVVDVRSATKLNIRAEQNGVELNFYDYNGSNSVAMKYRESEYSSASGWQNIYVENDSNHYRYLIYLDDQHSNLELYINDGPVLEIPYLNNIGIIGANSCYRADNDSVEVTYEFSEGTGEEDIGMLVIPGKQNDPTQAVDGNIRSSDFLPYKMEPSSQSLTEYKVTIPFSDLWMRGEGVRPQYLWLSVGTYSRSGGFLADLNTACGGQV